VVMVRCFDGPLHVADEVYGETLPFVLRSSRGLMPIYVTTGLSFMKCASLTIEQFNLKYVLLTSICLQDPRIH
jgi:hypothetical protein